MRRTSGGRSPESGSRRSQAAVRVAQAEVPADAPGLEGAGDLGRKVARRHHVGVQEEENRPLRLAGAGAKLLTAAGLAGDQPRQGSDEIRGGVA